MEILIRPVLQTFLNSDTSFEEARYTIIGAPLDVTASHRSGSRFAPEAIRRMSLDLESYSFRFDLDIDGISLADLGNISHLESINDLEKIVTAIRINTNAGKVPIMIGGEHTVTLAALRSIQPDLVISFDAHMDLRDTLLGEKLSHGTFMRRALEELDFELVLIGIRAVSKEELNFVRTEPRINFVSSRDLILGGLQALSKVLPDSFSVASSIYVSIDMDVVDPSMAPAVGNPSPEGISISNLLDVIQSINGTKITGLDLTEVTPLYDSGLTSTQAAYILKETILSLETSNFEIT